MTWVMLHGFLGRPSSWDAIVSRLPPRAHVLRPTLFGHGPVPAAAPVIEFDAEVDRIAQLVARESGRGVHLVGYSLGARIALRMLARHPGLVERATLIGVHPGLESDADRAARRAEDEASAVQAEREGLDAFVAAWERRPLFESQGTLPREVLESQRAIRLSHLADGVAASLRSLGLGSMPNLWPELPRLREPVTLVVGAHDAPFRALAVRAASLIPRARAVVIAGAGHNPTLERPDDVVRVLFEPPPGRESQP